MSSEKQKQIEKILGTLEEFKHFPSDVISDIAQNILLIKVAKDNWIIRKKEGRRLCYYMLRGKAEIVLSDQEDFPCIIKLENTQWLGEAFPLNIERLVFPTRAVNECMMLCFPEQWKTLTAQSREYLEPLLFESLDRRLEDTKILIKAKRSHVSFDAIVAEENLHKKKDKKVQITSKIDDIQEEVIVAPEDPPNPFAIPTGQADEYNAEIVTQDDYDVMLKKIHLRTQFIAGKIPQVVVDMVSNKLFGYWTGSKLAKVNPHRLWNAASFSPGSPRLLKSLHLVVLHPQGDAMYDEAYLKLPISHRTIGLPEVGCAGTFLGNEEAIERYFTGKNLKSAIKLDFEIPVEREFLGKDSIEFLTHTNLDVRDQTLFLVFDDKDGKYTLMVREKFPEHQIITVVPGLGFKMDDPGSIFTHPEEVLMEEGICVPKGDFKHIGFYLGETFFFPDFSELYKDSNINASGYLFGTIGLLAQIGPDYSGLVWGSKGGAEGAVRAAKAMFGIKGAQSQTDLNRAVQWADN